MDTIRSIIFTLTLTFRKPTNFLQSANIGEGSLGFSGGTVPFAPLATGVGGRIEMSNYISFIPPFFSSLRVSNNYSAVIPP